MHLPILNSVGNLFGNWALILGPWFCLCILSTRLLSGVLLSWNKAWMSFPSIASMSLGRFCSLGFLFLVGKLTLDYLGHFFCCLCISFTIVVFSWNKSLSGLFHFCFELIFQLLSALICPQVAQSCPVSMLLLMKGWKTVSCSYNPCTCSLFVFLHHVLKTGRGIVSR